MQRRSDIIRIIEKHLEVNEDVLRTNDRFKGLFGRRGKKRVTELGVSPSESPDPVESLQAAASGVANTAGRVGKKTAIAAKPVADEALDQGAKVARSGYERVKDMAANALGIEAKDIALPESPR